MQRKRKVIWLVLGSLVALSLVLASCAPAAPETPAPTPTPTPAPAPAPTPAPEDPFVINSVGNKVERPKRGGTFSFAQTRTIPGWDFAVRRDNNVNFIYDTLTWGDWARGMAGTGEMHWIIFEGNTKFIENHAPCLAKSWETTDPITMMFYLREGLHWQDKHPTNGREIVADDIVFASDRNWWADTSYAASWLADDQKFDSAVAVDKYTVKFTVQEPEHLPLMYMELMQYNYIYPRDAIEYYGDFVDWRNIVASGPFQVTDVVPGSVYTLSANPDYWDMQPLYPEERQPFVDEIKIYIINDKATLQAAFRANKLDFVPNLEFDDYSAISKTNPQVQYAEYPRAVGPMIFLPLNNPDLPWADKRVRRALQMAIDRESIKDGIYQGRANTYWWPVGYSPGTSDAFIPIEDLPTAAQELFEYNPEKAKQLLTEAGYPNGFKADIITEADFLDPVLLAQEYWADIGVDLNVQQLEHTVLLSTLTGMSQKGMVGYQGSASKVSAITRDDTSPNLYVNISLNNEPEIYQFHDERIVAYPIWDEVAKLYEWFTPWIIDHADRIQMPSPFDYYLWQPWIKDYNGEVRLHMGSRNDWIRYIWIDQELKQEITGQ